MSVDQPMTLGEMITALYDEFLVIHDGDAERASVSVAEIVNDMLRQRDLEKAGGTFED